MAESKQVRRGSKARRSEILEAARVSFLDRGFTDVGLTDIAAAGQVSRALVYRYFPDGRTDLYLAVADELLGELHERLRYAAGAPFSAETRMEHLLAALFAYFQEQPDAYRSLFRDMWAARDESIAASAVAARAPITAEIAGVLASAGSSADELTALGVGILGFALANVEMMLAGQIDPETAWRVTCAAATSQIPR
ncbi:MAG TPA: TetR/AcrR family transcriptional regulator [Acidimicrobiales bacterium]